MYSTHKIIEMTYEGISNTCYTVKCDSCNVSDFIDQYMITYQCAHCGGRGECDNGNGIPKYCYECKCVNIKIAEITIHCSRCKVLEINQISCSKFYDSDAKPESVSAFLNSS